MKKTKKTAKPVAKKITSKTTTASPLGIRPLGDRVLIQPLSAEEAGATTSFGLIIPDSSKEKPEQGTVIAVGPGRRSDDGDRMPLEVKPGDRVFFKKPWDEPIKVKGVEYYVISESDITLVVTK